jgi:hypothetical protein
MRGCRAPTLGGIPIALKLYGLKDAVFQAPLSPVNPRWNVWKGWLVRLEHFDADIGFLFFDVEREGFTLCDREVVNLFLFDEFAFRQIRKSRGLRVSSRLAHLQKLLSRRIVDRVDLLSGTPFQDKKGALGTCLTNLLFPPFPIHLFLNAFD